MQGRWMGLSPDEERHIQNLSLIPAAIVVYFFIGYFVYLVHIGELPWFSFWVWYFLLVFTVAMPLALFLSEEILYSRKIKRPFAFQAKRFLGRMSIFILGAFIFGVVWVTTNLALSVLIDESTLLVVSGIIWFGIWASLIFRFREEFDRLSRGS